MSIVRFLLAAGLGLGASSAASDGSPVGKALQLLTDLQAKIIKEGEDAQKVYSEFAEWCEERSKDLSYEIKTGKSEAAELKAAIDQGTATIGALQEKIESHASELTTDEADLKAATEIRSKEAASFAAAEKELVEVVDTLQRAIGILEREMKKGGASMLQLKGAKSLAQALDVLVQGSMLATADASRLAAFVQQTSSDDSDAGDVGAPAAATYESHSGDIVQTLTDLMEKAEEQLDDARKKETTDTHAFEMLKQSLEDEIKYGSKEMAEAKTDLAAGSQKKASAEGDLGMTSKELEADVKGLKDLHQQCMMKAEDFEAETKSRGEEITALTKAREVLKDNVGGASDLTYSFAQVSLLQVSSGITTQAALAQLEAVRVVRDLARKERSAELAQLAKRMQAAFRGEAAVGEDQFGKVKALIRDMLERLESEADADASHKAFCDKELAESNGKKADKEAEISKLTTQIDKMTARSAQLKEETAALQKALADLTRAQGEMDKIRAQEKEAFISNKADMEQGVKGVKLALKVLTEYYSQEDKAHSAADGAGGGIISLLEVVESDFTKGLAEMSAAEDSAEAAYDAQTKENAIQKATKEQDVKYKTKESTTLDKDSAESSSDRASVQAQLEAVNEYLKKIEDQCIAKAETFEERRARFEAELAGLKEALQILESETALVQRTSAAHRLRGVRRHVA